MSDDTPILSLPLILPAQAQKHVTHNEALRILDVLVQLVVADRTRTAPPAAPEDGDRHIIGPDPSGEWEGRSGWIASYWAGGWLYIRPRSGWSARVLAEGRTVVYANGGWTAETDGAAGTGNLLGLNATADETNRLTVSAAATLLTHEGAGHQLKLNKATPQDTASLLFQTGYAGRAEMGTVGDDDFRIRVSADGSAFADGAVFSAQTGLARLVSGATLPDGTAEMPAIGFDADRDTGLFRPATDALGFVAGGSERLRLTPDGYLRLAAGTGGIQFDGGTGADRALDAYQEGSFIPVARGSATGGSATYTAQLGRYTRIGNRIFYSAHLEWSGHDGTGDLVIAGLPVPSAGSTAAAQICQSGLSLAFGAHLYARLATGSDRIEPLQSLNGSLTAVTVPGAASVTVSGHYEV